MCDVSSEYIETGCLFLKGFFSQEVARKIQAWTDELQELEGVDITWEKGKPTRYEHFVHLHAGFRGIVRELEEACVQVFGGGEAGAIYKEKLNLKPPGGAGFVPHLDHPSLVYYAPRGVEEFVTAMVAIDPMTDDNGCLRICTGRWNKQNALSCIAPEGDPEVGGRAGALPAEVAERLSFSSVPASPGDVLFFNPFVPHRSGPNLSPHWRRAVFFTFCPRRLGEHRRSYYDALHAIRKAWQEKLASELHADYSSDVLAMASVPRSGFDRSLYAASARAYCDDDSSSESDRREETIHELF